MIRLLFMLAFIPVVAFAQMLGATLTTNKVYTSNVATNLAWERHVVTATGDDFCELRDKTRSFATVAEIASENEVTEHILEVEEAWSNGFARGYAELRSKLNNSPTNGILIGLQFPFVSSATRKATEIYVPASSYSSVDNCDYFFVYFSQALTVKPNMEVPYVWNGGFTTNRVVGTWDFGNYHWTNTVKYVQQGQTYDVHILRVPRPVELRNVACNMNPHGLFGKHGEGVTWGNIVLTVNNKPTFSGTITNSANNTFMVINNGAILAPGMQEVSNEE